MLHKFKTEVASVAFKARSGMPADYTRTVESDMSAILHLYGALFARGKREDFMHALSLVALSAMHEIMSTLPPEVIAAVQGMAASPAQAQAPFCNHCGGAHKTEAH